VTPRIDFPGSDRRDHAWSVRAADEEDAPAIARFDVSCWTDAYRGVVPDEVVARVDVEARTPRWCRRLVGGRRTTLLAELVGTANRVVGFASVGPSHDAPEPGLPALELASLYVARDLWGSGLADVLVARAVGDTPAHLWVHDANVRARAFYEKHGFVDDGVGKVDDETSLLERRYVRR
jgi:GNAT superfamily N-acetyltransferase